jgi:hypothetical protein
MPATTAVATAFSKAARPCKTDGCLNWIAAPLRAFQV